MRQERITTPTCSLYKLTIRITKRNQNKNETMPKQKNWRFCEIEMSKKEEKRRKKHNKITKNQRTEHLIYYR